MDEKDLQQLPNDPPRDELLARWLSGDLNAEEKKELEQSMSSDELDRLKQVTNASSQLRPPKFNSSAAWERLTTELGDELADEESAPKVIPMRSRRTPLIYFAVAASVALIAVLVVLNPFGGSKDPGNDWTAVTATEGKKTITLPDESVVDLNQGSTIRFASNWEGQERLVELDGEAYFKVAKGERFRVKSDAGFVDVLGTRFSVKTSGQDMQVNCFTGKVRVADPKDTELATLTPGLGAEVKGGNVKSKVIDDDLPEWAIREMKFPATPLPEVIAAMEKEFDVLIECNACEGLRYEGSFSNESVEVAVVIVASATGKRTERVSDIHYKLK